MNIDFHDIPAIDETYHWLLTVVNSQGFNKYSLSFSIISSMLIGLPR